MFKSGSQSAKANQIPKNEFKGIRFVNFARGRETLFKIAQVG